MVNETMYHSGYCLSQASGRKQMPTQPGFWESLLKGLFAEVGGICVCVCVCSITQSYPTLCDPMTCSPPGSSVPEISQARILERVAISFSRGSFLTRDQTRISSISKQTLCHLRRPCRGMGGAKRTNKQCWSTQSLTTLGSRYHL